jgi:hypothetical protein
MNRTFKSGQSMRAEGSEPREIRTVETSLFATSRFPRKMSQYNPASSNTHSDPTPRPPRQAPPLPPRRPLSDFYGQNASPPATTIAQNQNRYSQGSPTGGTILLNETEMKVLGLLSLINILLSNKGTAVHTPRHRVLR